MDTTEIITTATGRYLVIGRGTGLHPAAISGRIPEAPTHHWPSWKRANRGGGHTVGSLAYVLNASTPTYATEAAAEKRLEAVKARLAAAAERDAWIAACFA